MKIGIFYLLVVLKKLNHIKLYYATQNASAQLLELVNFNDEQRAILAETESTTLKEQLKILLEQKSV